MTFQHRGLASGRWHALRFVEQMANIGSEVERTIAWRAKGQHEISRRAFERALELIDLTVSDSKNRRRLRELLRVRELLADHFICGNDFQTTPESWQHYFRFFLNAARGNR